MFSGSRAAGLYSRTATGPRRTATPRHATPRPAMPHHDTRLASRDPDVYLSPRRAERPSTARDFRHRTSYSASGLQTHAPHSSMLNTGPDQSCVKRGVGSLRPTHPAPSHPTTPHPTPSQHTTPHHPTPHPTTPHHITGKTKV